MIEPDYNSTSGRSVRIIGSMPSLGDVIAVIVVVDEGVVYGVNAWKSNGKDRRIYREGDA